MNHIKRRLNSLRDLMVKKNIDYVYVVTSDPHQSEYVDGYFKTREFISGFTGSNGDVFIGNNNAILWTDGRYYIQAEKELTSDFTLYKQGKEGVPTFLEYVRDLEEKNVTIAVDFKTLSIATGLKLMSLCKEKEYRLIDEDLIGLIWENRPKRSCSFMKEVPLSISGMSRGNKLEIIRNDMISAGIDALVLSALDEIMWLMNIRGEDIEYCPLLLSYAIVFKDCAYLFLQDGAYDEKVFRRWEYEGIHIESYDYFFEILKTFENKKIALDSLRVNYKIFELLSQKNVIELKGNNIQHYKAIKNKTEISNMKKAHRKDAIAMVKFLHYLETCEDEDEYSLGEKLLKFRKMQPNFIEPSFETICGFLDHGAIVHYAATKDSAYKIEGNGLLLIDSGGQYREGTTDITRTIVRGKIPYSMKKDFTLVLKGHLQLMNAHFIRGCTGSNLDVMARASLWKEGKNYAHGTGHGVGYCLNVHEGPHSISFYRKNDVMIEPGMIVSNEPGFYLKNHYGIRLENLLLCIKDKETVDGVFYKFENLTLVPFDRRGILKNLLTLEEKMLLDAYHQRVYDELSSSLNAEERRFLKWMTRPL